VCDRISSIYFVTFYQMGSIFSSNCVLCGSSTREKISLCLACQDDLPRIEGACTKCGIPVVSNESMCGKCLHEPPIVDYTFSMYHYESPVDSLITQLKFKQQLSSAAILGVLMEKLLRKDLVINGCPDVILPVPLHKGRLSQRGFNQSLEISKPISDGLNIPIDYLLARRIKSTKSQMDLRANERKRNIKGCFQVRLMPAYQHVVLVDDVVTTGSTTNELAKALKKSGVEKVGVWAVARARIRE